MSTRHWISLLALACLPALARADACHDALAAFDYGRAESLAQARLAAEPNDLRALMCRARAAYETGRFPRAHLLLRQVEAGQPQGEARTYLYNWMTVTLRRLGREAEALQYGQAALARARLEANRQNLATALHNYAGLMWERRDAGSAIALYLESIPLNPDLSERSASLNNLGLIEQALGRPRAAEGRLVEAIALNREHGHYHHLGKHLMNLGNLYREQRRFAESGALLDEGAALVERAGDLYWEAVAARYRGWLARDRQDWQAARRWLAEAARIYDTAGAALDATVTRAELAGLTAY
jgi:tetratricopeptide (TPR) repeat protein